MQIDMQSSGGSTSRWLVAIRKSLGRRVVPCVAVAAFVNACATVSSPLDEALIRAVATGDSNAAVQALDAGANPNITRDDGAPLVVLAVQNDDKVVLDRMIQTANGKELLQHALHLAALQSKLDLMDHLLKQGADPNYRDDNGVAALHLAANGPSPAGVEKLLAAGADVNARGHAGTTALITAASNGYARTARALIAAGADPNLQDRSGASAVSWATAREDSEMLEILRAAGASEAGTPPSIPALKQAARAQRGGEIEIRTSGVTTDGRHIKIRGSVVNRFPEVVDGVYFRVLIISRDGARVLDTFHDESDVRLAPGDTGPLRLDISTMYAATEGRFVVEGRPRRLGDSDFELPSDW